MRCATCTHEIAGTNCYANDRGQLFCSANCANNAPRGGYITYTFDGDSRVSGCGCFRLSGTVPLDCAFVPALDMAHSKEPFTINVTINTAPDLNTLKAELLRTFTDIFKDLGRA